MAEVPLENSTCIRLNGTVDHLENTRDISTRVREPDSIRTLGRQDTPSENFNASDNLRNQFEANLSLEPLYIGTHQKGQAALTNINTHTDLSKRIHSQDVPGLEYENEQPGLTQVVEEGDSILKRQVNNEAYLGTTGNRAVQSSEVDLISNSTSQTSESTTGSVIRPTLEPEYSRANRDSEVQRLVLLVGLQGSGKSTFAMQLVEHGWSRVSQDDLKMRHLCKLMTAKELRRGCNVVIDRCNFDKTQRAHWIQLAREHRAVVGCVVFAFPLSICIDRVQQRKDHPQLKPGPYSTSIVYKTAARFRPPKQCEGILWCRYIRSNSDIKNVLDEILTQPAIPCETSSGNDPSCHQPFKSDHPVTD